MKILEDNKAYIIDYYNNDGNLRELAAIYKCDQRSIKKRLAWWGVNKRPHIKNKNILLGRDEEIMELYSKKWSAAKIARYMEVSPGAIKSRIYKLNLNFAHTPSATKVYEVNHNFFEKIDTEEKAYLFGLWMADGSVGKNYISLTMKDKDIIEKIKITINYTGSIYIRQPNIGKNLSYTVQVYSKKLCQDLKNKGCIPKKSLVLKFPYEHIPKILLRHFLRGLFDGDGCIYTTKKGYNSVHLTGTREICEGFSQSCQISGGYTHSSKTGKNTWCWRVAQKEYVNYFLDLLYSNCNIYLDRKKLLADNILKVS